MGKPDFIPRSSSDKPCVILVGMPGSGKSTVGRLLAARLGWALLDTDYVIESMYGTRLQDITDSLGKEAFLDLEAQVIQSLRASRTVVSTGGSVIYREAAMRHLQRMGKIVYLEVGLTAIMRRVARNPERGIAIAPGQTLADLFAEREPLYCQWAELRCATKGLRAPDCARWIHRHLPAAMLADQGAPQQPSHN